MIKLGHFTLVVFSSMLCIANTQAGSLEKYGGQSDFRPAPRVTQSPRDIAIERAVQVIQNAAPVRQNAIIKEYSRRAKAALENGKYDEAQYYSDILRRSGH